MIRHLNMEDLGQRGIDTRCVEITLDALASRASIKPRGHGYSLHLESVSSNLNPNNKFPWHVAVEKEEETFSN